MKAILFTTMVLISCIEVFSQDIKVQEPDFIGQALLLKSDGSTEPLEKTPAKSTTKTKFSIINPGMTQSVSLEGCCAAIKAEVTNGMVKLIIRVPDNNLDPTDVVQVIQFEKSKKERTAETLTMSAFKGMDQGSKIKRATFFGKKYGEFSYILNVSVPGPGEYGIFLPETNGQPVKFISTFSVM